MSDSHNQMTGLCHVLKQGFAIYFVTCSVWAAEMSKDVPWSGYEGNEVVFKGIILSYLIMLSQCATRNMST